jgi:hypothetical protein
MYAVYLLFISFQMETYTIKVYPKIGFPFVFVFPPFLDIWNSVSGDFYFSCMFNLKHHSVESPYPWESNHCEMQLS